MTKTWKNAAEMQELFVGKKFRTTRASGQYPKGFTFTCTACYTGASSKLSGSDVLYFDEYSNSIPVSACEFLEETKEQLESQIKSYNEEMASLKLKIEETVSKIKFMTENKLKVFDEDQWKVYRVLEVIEGSKSRLEQAKAIAELIRK